MTDPSFPPGQLSGHPSGLSWEELIEAWVAVYGSLAKLAELLAADRNFKEDSQSIERGLRRLRGKGFKDGGVWGRRFLQHFGLPFGATKRVRWMGLYHSRYSDLPRSLCEELLKPWDQPPVSESSARVWLNLARASLWLRGRCFKEAEESLEAAKRAEVGPGDTLERLLLLAYTQSRLDKEAPIEAWMEEAEGLLGEVMEADDKACWQARIVDQKGWLLNVRRSGRKQDPEAAWRLYQALPDKNVPPFALCRRANGLAWSAYKLGRIEEAVYQARLSVREAGDSGSLRLRAMALAGLGRFLGDSEEGRETLERARVIAERLEDAELKWRWG